MQQISTEHLPKYHREAFYCPRCKVLSPQHWYNVINDRSSNEKGYTILIEEVDARLAQQKAALLSTMSNFSPMEEYTYDWHLQLSICQHCKNYSIWDNKKIIFPNETELPEPNGDMPQDVKEIYREAMDVFKHSPRAAAALLRLAIETMIPQLEEYEIKKAKINTMIGELVQKGIPEHIQQGLDAIRIYGNEGIHPGEIALNDDQETVMFLFELINIMSEELITRKKKISSFYSKLPFDKIKGILNRDKQKQESK